MEKEDKTDLFEKEECFDILAELEKEFLMELSEFFKVFGDGTRIRILQILQF